MKIKVNRKIFIAAAETAQGCITKSTLPILNCILINADDADNVFLRGSNSSSYIDVKLTCDVLDRGVAAVPLTIIKYLKNIFGDTFELEVQENYHAVLTCGKTEITIPCQDPKDYPIFGEFDPVFAAKVNGKQFLNAIKYGGYASATKDDSRKVLEGLLCQFENDGSLTVVSTDGKRLAIHNRMIGYETSTGENAKFILPASASYTLGLMLFSGSQEGNDTELTVGEKQIKVETANEIFCCRLVEGNYPNYRQVIPESFKYKIPVDITTFHAKIKMLSMVDDQNSNCTLTFNPKSIKLEAKSLMNGTVKDEIELPEQTGIEDSVSVTLNAKFITDSLNACRDTSEQFILCLNDAVSPLKFSFDFDSTGCIIMPLRNK